MHENLRGVYSKKLGTRKTGLLRKRFQWVCFLSLLLGACTSDTPSGDTTGISDDTILIGSSSALGGHARFLGTQYTLGSQAWFKALNASGGIHGRKIELIAYDDGYEPDRTINNTKKLITEDSVFLLFNYVGTPTSVQIIDMVHQHAIPAFGFLTGAELLRTPYRPEMFHVRASYYREAEGAVAFFVDHLGFDRIGVMYQDDAFGTAVLTGVQLSMHKRGLEIVATDSYTRGSLVLDRPVETLSNNEVQAVILVGTYSPLAKFIADMNLAGQYPYFHTVSFVGSDAFGKAILERGVEPSQFEKIIVTQVVPSPFSDELDTVAEYRSHLARYFPEETPNFVSLEGYINARVLTEMLLATGPDLTREKLKKTIEETSRLEVGIGNALTYGVFDHSGLDNIYYSRLSEEGHFSVFNFSVRESSGTIH